jgi:predicted hydrocarbon binding protein
MPQDEPDSPAPVQAPPLVVDPATGYLTLWGLPAWLMSPRYQAEIQAELEAISGKAAKGILYRVAFRSGRRAVEGLGLASPPGTPEAETIARLLRLQDIALAAGHGFSQITFGNLAKREVTWTVKQSLLASLHPPSRESVCHYYEGFLAGFVTSLFGSPVEALEMECRAKGDARCVFRTKPTAIPPV